MSIFDQFRLVLRNKGLVCWLVWRTRVSSGSDGKLLIKVLQKHEIRLQEIKMHGLYSLFVSLLLALMVISTEAGKGKKGQKGASECTEWQYGSCVPNIGDCGTGMREGTCNLQVKKLKCHVPCGWKKDFGADCKYRFGSWGECDSTTGTKNRVGTLKKALYNAECLATREVSKPCHSANGKAKTKVKGWLYQV
uniref:Midkine n=1 Tax=Paramormyrops kingsleyae TaxID=1676925 RepID=A0A3B3SQ49_9TELE